MGACISPDISLIITIAIPPIPPCPLQLPQHTMTNSMVLQPLSPLCALISTLNYLTNTQTSIGHNFENKSDMQISNTLQCSLCITKSPRMIGFVIHSSSYDTPALLLR